MANYEQYDPRVDELVIEARTFWDQSVAALPEDDKAWLSRAIHRAPQQASKIHYERAHTGFSRDITVTLEDVQRLYQERLA